jgi:hypothetical protein
MPVSQLVLLKDVNDEKVDDPIEAMVLSRRARVLPFINSFQHGVQFGLSRHSTCTRDWSGHSVSAFFSNHVFERFGLSETLTHGFS